MSLLVKVDPKLVAKHKLINLFHSVLLLSGMIMLLGFLGWSIAGGDGIKWMLFMGGLMFIFGPRISPNIILFLYGARPLSREEVSVLFDVLENLCKRAGLKYIPLAGFCSL